jgi:signal transduction histidine kinase
VSRTPERIVGVNPTLQRWLPVVVLPPVLLADGLLSDHHGKDGVDVWDVAVAYVAPLVWREREEADPLAPLLVGSVVVLLWAFAPGTTVVGLPAWALFELARRNGRRDTIVAATLVPACVLVCVLPFTHDGAELVSVWLRNLLICELALAVGYVMWHSQNALEAEAERRLTEERLRIAREVHDVVAHAMVAINVQSGVAAHLLEQDSEQARAALQQIKQASGDALNDLRATLGVLRDPDQAAPVGPAAGLEELDEVAAQLRAAGVEVTVDVDAARGVPTPVGSAGYRIVQEALTNVLRHARASRAAVVVRADEQALTISVTDDGTGPGGSGGAGAGVRGMRERAAALGGTLSAGPVAGGGWQVSATLPLPAS